MSRLKFSFLLGLATFTLLANQELVAASETNQGGSAISIDIVERKLAIESVQLPQFGKQELKDKGQTITSVQDFVLRIKDKRSSQAPWVVSCSFKPDGLLKEYQNQIVYRMGEGVLATVNAGEKERADVLPRVSYSANEFVMGNSEESTELVKLVQEKTEAETIYEYRIKKTDITFKIPAGLPAGIYDGTQVLLLADVPL